MTNWRENKEPSIGREKRKRRNSEFLTSLGLQCPIFQLWWVFIQPWCSHKRISLVLWVWNQTEIHLLQEQIWFPNFRVSNSNNLGGIAHTGVLENGGPIGGVPVSIAEWSGAAKECSGVEAGDGGWHLEWSGRRRMTSGAGGGGWR